MARNTGRTVYLRTDGQWANKGNDALRASSFHGSLDDACLEASTMLQHAGGGALTVRSEDGGVEKRQVPPPQTS
jgi:hypothetical protein